MSGEWSPFARACIKQEIKGLSALASSLNGRDEGAALDAAIVALYDAKLVITTGVGKSGHVAKKLASTLTSLGTPAVFCHPTEASHGDLGLFVHGNVLLALSRSGSARELLPVFRHCMETQIPIILITERTEHGLAALADVVLRLPRVAEAWGHAPTTSTIMQMALGDALAVCLAHQRGFTAEDFRRTHPGGALSEKEA